jgi:thiamine-monophosphate kinase
MPERARKDEGGEFDIIRELFAPLSKGAEGAFNLADDVAQLASSDYVVTKDLMVEGVHFLKSEPLDLVARKLIRVNLSDLAAKGARPVGYFLGCVWPSAAKRQDVELFAKGLAADQELFRIRLYGGDTTKHKIAAGPLTLSATFFGQPPRQGIVRREGAAAGDDLYVTGTIGDAGLGIAALRKAEKFGAAEREVLVRRYQTPEPRLTLGGALPGLASAAIDVSDGLIADAGHLAEIAGLAIEINASGIPRSPAAQAWLSKQEDANTALGRLATFGDDYEILFAAPQARRRAVAMASNVSKTPVARIGLFARGKGVKLLSGDGSEIALYSRGYDHFRS